MLRDFMEYIKCIVLLFLNSHYVRKIVLFLSFQKSEDKSEIVRLFSLRKPDKNWVFVFYPETKGYSVLAFSPGSQ